MAIAPGASGGIRVGVMIMTSMTPASALDLVRNPMSADAVRAVVAALLSGGMAPPDGAAVLSTWTARGETAVELAALVGVLVERCQRIPLAGRCFDLCGTGGSDLTRFNVSTTVAFILAAAGVPVAKHGNRGSRRPNGSFDLLDALGIPFQLPPEALARLHAETGVCFLFARAMHPAMAAVAPMRKLVAGRTIFNLAGPLANPVRPRRQIIGTARESTAAIIAEALTLLEVDRAFVVRGHPGIDEVSVCGPSQVWDIHEGRSVTRGLDHLHHPGLDHHAIPGGDATDNAPLFTRLLSGAERGPLFDMVVANAALALDCWYDRDGLGTADSINQARDLLLGGKVADTVDRHRRLALTLIG